MGEAKNMLIEAEMAGNTDGRVSGRTSLQPE